MAKIGKMIDNLTGRDDEEKRMKEQFTFLQKMARAKSDTYENNLKLMLSNKQTAGLLEIVGDKAFEYHNSQHVNISQDCNDAITDAVDEFFKGGEGIKEGFRLLVKQGLSGLIGNTAIGEVEEKMFFVYPENYSIVRVDVMAYKYTFSSTGVLVKDVENIFVYTMAKSIVDHTKVGVDFLMHAVVDMMREEPGKEPDLDEVMPFIRKLQACWRMLDGSDTPADKALLKLGAAPSVSPRVEKSIKETVAALTPADILASAARGAQHE